MFVIEQDEYVTVWYTVRPPSGDTDESTIGQEIFFEAFVLGDLPSPFGAQYQLYKC